MFLFRFIGVFTLGNLVMFLNRLLEKQDRLPRVVVGVVWVLPVVIGLVVVLAGGSSYAICGGSDSLIMTNVLGFCYDYIAILFLVNVIILAVCNFYRIYIYTEEDVARMERHFGVVWNDPRAELLFILYNSTRNDKISVIINARLFDGMNL